jgi:putative transposase
MFVSGSSQLSQAGRSGAEKKGVRNLFALIRHQHALTLLAYGTLVARCRWRLCVPCVEPRNRAIAAVRQAGDYAAFEKVLAGALVRFVDMRLLAYCVMPNHWHLLLWPQRDGELSTFVGWMTLTHTQRWHAQHHSTGSGHLYQGRFKSFPVACDEHFWTVCRYVERNALRAGLVKRAEQWRWGSLWPRDSSAGPGAIVFSDWPVPRPADWAKRVNAAQSEAELAAIRQCVSRGRPFGPLAWVAHAVTRLKLQTTLRPRGRPPKRPLATTAKGS